MRKYIHALQRKNTRGAKIPAGDPKASGVCARSRTHRRPDLRGPDRVTADHRDGGRGGAGDGAGAGIRPQRRWHHRRPALAQQPGRPGAGIPSATRHRTALNCDERRSRCLWSLSLSCTDSTDLLKEDAGQDEPGGGAQRPHRLLLPAADSRDSRSLELTGVVLLYSQRSPMRIHWSHSTQGRLAKFVLVECLPRHLVRGTVCLSITPHN